MSAQRSLDVRLPLWLRVVALGVERAEPNVLGHAATFSHGEMRQQLDPQGLGLAPASVTRAIAAGVDRGLLHPGSNARALYLVPGALTFEDTQ